MGMKWLLCLALPALVAAACIEECIKANSYYKKSCPDGIELGAECSDDQFCSTPYARCMDGKCSCLPDFVVRNVTYGRPSICVPETQATPALKRDPTADVCRINDPATETFSPSTLKTQLESKEYNALVMPQMQVSCPDGCNGDSDSKVRRKRQSGYVLPPTVVNQCRTGQLCYQLGPSAYGVCKRPTCPVGTPGSTKKPCAVGDDTTCPSGFHCSITGGQSLDLATKTYSQATMCCPSICNNGYYRNGRCWRDTNCLGVQDDCEDRCNFSPCRFMVDPCQNYGMCLVPKTVPGTSPDYFWCKCAAGSGKAGRVCEQDGEDLNRPTKKRQIACEGSLCERPPVRVYAPLVAAPAVGPAAPILSAFQTHRTMTCRQDSNVATCERLATEGACSRNRDYMLQNCDCACTKLMNKNKGITYYPIPFNSRTRN